MRTLAKDLSLRDGEKRSRRACSTSAQRETRPSGSTWSRGLGPSSRPRALHSVVVLWATLLHTCALATGPPSTGYASRAQPADPRISSSRHPKLNKSRHARLVSSRPAKHGRDHGTADARTALQYSRYPASGREASRRPVVSPENSQFGLPNWTRTMG